MPDRPPAPAPDVSGNMTHAGITGKVPDVFRRGGRRRKGKPAKLSADGKRHARSLQRQGVISQRAAAANGLAK